MKHDLHKNDVTGIVACRRCAADQRMASLLPCNPEPYKDPVEKQETPTIAGVTKGRSSSDYEHGQFEKMFRGIQVIGHQSVPRGMLIVMSAPDMKTLSELSRDGMKLELAIRKVIRHVINVNLEDR